MTSHDAGGVNVQYQFGRASIRTFRPRCSTVKSNHGMSARAGLGRTAQALGTDRAFQQLLLEQIRAEVRLLAAVRTELERVSEDPLYAEFLTMMAMEPERTQLMPRIVFRTEQAAASKADAIVDAVANGRALVLVGPAAKQAYHVKRLSRTLAHKLTLVASRKAGYL